MTEEPDRPLHPLHQMTTSELNTYRRQLEQALRQLPEHAPVRELLGEKLAGIQAEQADRAQIARSDGG